MPDAALAVQYFMFMKWFKINHRNLFEKYKVAILVPTEHHQVSVNTDSIALQDRTAMQRIIEAYYTVMD